MTDLTPAELELTVLSSLLSLDSVRRAETAGICEDSFQVDAHARAWLYIMGRAEVGAAVSAGDLRAACGVEVHADVTDDSTFVAELARVTLTRQVRAALITNVGTLEQDPVETIQSLVGALNGVMKAGKGRTVYFDADALERYQGLVAKQEALGRGESVGIPTGLPCFDEPGDHWQPGEVCAIIGPLNVGKSTLLFWLAANVYHKARKKVLILSPESTVEEVNAKLDATIGGWMGYDFSVRDLIQGKANPDQFKRYAEELMLLERKDLIVRDSGSHGVFSLADITALVHQYEPDFLAIDGFHLISGKGDSWQKMQDAAIAVKGLAQGMNMVVAATAQVQRSALMAPDNTAEVGQSAYGLALGEAANRVISMAALRNQPTQRIFKVPKLRGAPVINFRKYLSFDPDHGSLHQVDVNRDYDSGEVRFD